MVLKLNSTQQTSTMVVLKLSWQREKLKQFNTVEFCKGGHASACVLLKFGAWITRVAAKFTRRENLFLDKGDAWQPLIGWADFYLIFIFKLIYFIAN
jgi:hypothetical protein